MCRLVRVVGGTILCVNPRLQINLCVMTLVQCISERDKERVCGALRERLVGGQRGEVGHRGLFGSSEVVFAPSPAQ